MIFGLSESSIGNCRAVRFFERGEDYQRAKSIEADFVSQVSETRPSGRVPQPLANRSQSGTLSDGRVADHAAHFLSNRKTAFSARCSFNPRYDVSFCKVAK